MNTLEFKVLLTTPREVSAFVETAASINKDTTITAGHGKYTVDARSIMGMYSLNLSEPILIKMETKVNELSMVAFERWAV